MPIYMDRHDLPGVTAKDVAEAHQKDLKIQHLYDCRAITYWFDEERQTAFCLIEAPNKEAVKEMHKNAHGLTPHQIIEVNNQIVESFLGRIEDPEELKYDDQHYLNEPAFRAILAIQIITIKLNAKDGMLNSALNIERVLYYVNKYNGRSADQSENTFLYSFTTARQAIECAIAIRQSLLDLSAEKQTTIQIKTGLSAGSPIEEKNDFFGEPIKTAKNLCFISNNNQIMISHMIKDHCLKEGFSCELNTDDLKALTQTEENLNKQLLIEIEKTIHSSGFTTNDLAREMGVSKSQLYRKVVALTHISPNDLVKEYKLNCALTLMNQGLKTISEIAYETGFGSPSYFSKCFKKQFGILPSSYIATPSQ